MRAEKPPNRRCHHTVPAARLSCAPDWGKCETKGSRARQSHPPNRDIHSQVVRQQLEGESCPFFPLSGSTADWQKRNYSEANTFGTVFPVKLSLPGGEILSLCAPVLLELSVAHWRWIASQFNQ
jgi:hypothetical protein